MVAGFCRKAADGSMAGLNAPLSPLGNWEASFSQFGTFISVSLSNRPSVPIARVSRVVNFIHRASCDFGLPPNEASPGDWTCRTWMRQALEVRGEGRHEEPGDEVRREFRTLTQKERLRRPVTTTG